MYNYFDWFNNNGGANFIVNEKLSGVQKKFQKNKYFFVKPNLFLKLTGYRSYLKTHILSNYKVDFYFSYGIPTNFKVAEITWIHICNVLPLITESYGMNKQRVIINKTLGFLLKKSFSHYDYISSESNFSLSLVPQSHKNKCLLLENGVKYDSNFDLQINVKHEWLITRDYFITAGTQEYKNLIDVYNLFVEISKNYINPILIIIGPKNSIPQSLLKIHNIIFLDEVPHNDLLILFKNSKSYISASKVENSSNTSLDALLFSPESYLSIIEPNLELLDDLDYNIIKLKNKETQFLHIKKVDIKNKTFYNWETIIEKMVYKIKEKHNELFHNRC